MIDLTLFFRSISKRGSRCVVWLVV